MVDQLTQAEIDEAEQATEIWRAENVIRDFADLLPEDTEWFDIDFYCGC